MTTDKQEIDSRAESKKFLEEYIEARNKARDFGYNALTSYERLVLEKGDDYLLG